MIIYSNIHIICAFISLYGLSKEQDTISLKEVAIALLFGPIIPICVGVLTLADKEIIVWRKKKDD